MIFMNKISSLLIATYFISSCTNMPFEAIVPTARSVLIGAEKLNISKDFYEAQEYSFANVRIGRNVSAILVLEAIIDDTYVWTSSDGEKIYTYNGKIVKTIGLERDIEIFNGLLFNFERGHNFQYEVMLSSPSAFLEIYSEMSLDLSKNLYLEKMSSKVLSWKHQNTYKTNSDGQVIFSKQKFHPFEPAIEIEFYYK